MSNCRLGSEDGWVLVPVIILMVVAIGVGTALLTIVDTQTQQSGKQRKVDSAQTLAEGAVSATANVLAVDNSASMWPVSGGCVTVSGDLTNPSTQPSTSLAAKITTEVQARFSGTSPDYGATAARNTTWRVDVCPVQGSESRWEEAILTRNTAAPAGSPALVSLWVRGQASVSGSTAATSPENSRAVVSKVRQSATSFAPPENFAVGTGVFSTDVGTTLNTALTSNTSLVGSIASTALGTSPVIKASTSNIGVRCGLLTTLDSPDATCLAGALAGVAGVTNATGLGTLNTILGIDRTKALGTWSMAPDDAIEQWRREAQASGVYNPAPSMIVPGYGNDITKDVGGGSSPTNDCFLGNPTPSQVIFIEQVGDGDDYCNVPAGKTAKILIVARGAVHIQGTFTGVVYMLNKQECGPVGDDTCSEDDREDADTREVVRIEGSGKVIGSVWADGAGGAVGIYPPFSPSSVPSASLLAVGDATTGICGLPAVGPALTTVSTAINAITGLVGNTLSLVTGVEEQVRYPGGGGAPTACSLLQGKLAGLTSSQLLDLFGTASTQLIVTSERRTRTCRTYFLLVCTSWNGWSDWTTRDTSSVALPALLSGAPASAVSQLGGLLGNTLTNYTAIEYNATIVADSAATITQGAAPVVGTYRNVASIQ